LTFFNVDAERLPAGYRRDAEDTEEQEMGRGGDEGENFLRVFSQCPMPNSP